MHFLAVAKGVDCFLVLLTDKDPRKWKLIRHTKTEQEAFDLAYAIQGSVTAIPPLTPSEVDAWTHGRRLSDGS